MVMETEISSRLMSLKSASISASVSTATASRRRTTHKNVFLLSGRLTVKTPLGGTSV